MFNETCYEGLSGAAGKAAKAAKAANKSIVMQPLPGTKPTKVKGSGAVTKNVKNVTKNVTKTVYKGGAPAPAASPGAPPTATESESTAAESGDGTIFGIPIMYVVIGGLGLFLMMGKR